MRIVEGYSYLNGHEHMLIHKPSLWSEIENVIAAVDAEQCRTKRTQGQHAKEDLFYSSTALNSAFQVELTERGWKEPLLYLITTGQSTSDQTMHQSAAKLYQETFDQETTSIARDNQTDFVKDRIAIEVQFGKYTFVAYDLFVKHMAFYVGDVIDVGVEILPMKSLQAHMSSGVGYYEGELYNLIRQGRGVPAVPLVMIGVAP
ncbi:MAG TPA: BglII/BstYI family type II restriction endonuclease [Roseiflexaceae bacterium]|jgi:hypothetical protein|nr:BglII/BstYI family type II restriction endonuclease [Roseiflexaceae bacterium]